MMDKKSFEYKRMDYELSIGNAERIACEVQSTLDNLEELIIPLREEIDKTQVRQTRWIGAVDTFRNIASLLSHELDELQNAISRSKMFVREMIEECEPNDGKNV